MQDRATRASRNDDVPSGRVKVPDRAGFAVAAGAGALLTITGAFDTGSAPFWLRLGYWMTVMLSGALIGTAVTDMVHRWGRLARLPLVEGALIAVAIAAPLSLLVSGASVVAFGLTSFSMARLTFMFVAVLAVSCIMVAINYLMAAQRRAGMLAARLSEPAGIAADNGAPLPTMAPPAVEASKDSTANADIIDRAASKVGMAPVDRFRDRLPLHLRQAQLLAVASEDHYLRVHTDAGEALILMRMGDALAELADVAGAQTHRSWWVAAGAVVAVERLAGKAQLHLSGGLTAPVSRSFLPVLAAMGWR